MKILMSEIATDQARVAASILKGAGHDVVTCGDVGHRAIACAALRGEACPIETQDIDVALYVDRSEPAGLLDEGLLCALRHFIPLVVATSSPVVLPDPFGSWAAAICDMDQLDCAIRAAAKAPLQAHSVAAERAANGVLSNAGSSATWEAVVRRDGRRLRVELSSPEEVEPDLCARSAVRAEGAIREIDRVSQTIDVETVTKRV